MGSVRKAVRASTQGGELLRLLKEEVAARLGAVGDRLQVVSNSQWVAFRSQGLRRVFAEIRPNGRNIEAFILPGPETIRGNALARSAPPTQGWGWFKSKFRVSNKRDIPAAVDLLYESYVVRRGMNHKRNRSTP